MKNRFPKITQINTRLIDKQYNDVVNIENTMVFKSTDREYYLNIVKSRITALDEIINEKYGNDLVKLETKLRDMSDILDDHDIHMDYRGPTDRYTPFSRYGSMALSYPTSYTYSDDSIGAVPYMDRHAMPMHVFHGPDNTKIYGVSNTDLNLMVTIKEYYTVVLTNIGNLDSRYRSSSELHLSLIHI